MDDNRISIVESLLAYEKVFYEAIGTFRDLLVILDYVGVVLKGIIAVTISSDCQVLAISVNNRQTGKAGVVHERN